MTSFTVPERIRALKIEPSNTFAWIVGAEVRGAFERLHGRSPTKQLRKKTKGGGSHCFAVYPAGFRRHADRIIKRIAKSMAQEKARQFDMFEKGPA